MEAAFSKDIMKRLGEGIEKTTSEYINKGVTVICEGAGGNNMARDIERMIEKGIFKNRYIICPSYTGTVPPLYSAKDRLKIINGPVKLIMDGSIQNYTAYMREDYYKAHPTRENKDSPAGFPHMTLEELTKRIGEICCSGRTFAVHANGDKALDMVIKATEECFKRGQINDGPNLVIHCQNADKKQLEKMKALSLYPSFFPVHIYIYGDRHYEMFLGPKRSERINPINDAVKIGNIFSIHSDSPVAPCNPLELVWCAVKRQTASGRILGEEQRISVYEAFKGVTINAALSYGVGDELGSLCEGKRADFVVLDKNPLKTEIDEIPKIKVENVYIDGEKIK